MGAECVMPAAGLTREAATFRIRDTDERGCGRCNLYIDLGAVKRACLESDFVRTTHY